MTSQWTAVFLGGLAVGASVVGLLVAQRVREPLAFLLGVAGVILGTWGVIEIVDTYRRIDMIAAAIGLSLASVGGGYALASSLLPYLTSTRRAPSLPELVEARTTRPVVLLLCCTEPPRYKPAAITDELDRLAHAGLPEATLGITPFLYAAQKARYRAMGGVSPSAQQAKAVAERLERRLRESIHYLRLVTCVGRDTLDRAVAEAASGGATDVIVATISVAESYATDRAKSSVDSMRPDAHGMHVVNAAQLWGSEALAEHVAEQIWRARDEPTATGVALMLHGQPDEWERSHAAFDEQENSFAHRIRMMLSERGIPQDNIRLCYAEWRVPDLTETVRHLAALGCRRVLICPACFPFESSATLLDAQVAIKQARVEGHVSTVMLSAWGEDPIVSDVLFSAIRAASRELGNEL